jgi:hypothetical protein
MKNVFIAVPPRSKALPGSQNISVKFPVGIKESLPNSNIEK